MSSVGYPATDSRSSRHYFCCNRNPTAWPIQMEEKALIMNYFMVQRKERYLRPHIIIISITMPIVAPDSGVLSLCLNYPQSLSHELCCSRLPFLFLILRFFLINVFCIKLCVRMRQV